MSIDRLTLEGETQTSYRTGQGTSSCRRTRRPDPSSEPRRLEPSATVAGTIRLVRGLLCLLLTTALCAVPGLASAEAPGEPPIDWTVRSTFIGSGGEDIPLRIGQHDSAIRDGFGVRHILDGHDQLPDDHDMAVVLGGSDRFCDASAKDDRSRCYLQIGDRGLVVVFTETIRNDSPDDRPTGIITAYYTPRGCPC